MIAMMDVENSCHSSSSHESGEKVSITLDHHHHRPLSTPLPLPPSLRKYTRLSTQTYVSQKMKFTFLLMGTRQKRLAGRVVIFETFALAGWGWGRGVFYII